MVMLSFDNMDLSKIGLDAFDPANLYCTDDSPLQNQTLFPGCYGICANPDISGIGNRLSLYIQTLLTLWLATLTPNPADTVGAMLAAIAATWTIFVATLVQYNYNNITFHHTLITINLSSMPTVAFLAAILRLRLQPGVIPLGPKIFATPILVLQLLACVVSVMLGIGLNTIIKQDDVLGGGKRGSNGWEVAQQQCNPDTKIIIFGGSLQFWNTQSVEEVSNLPEANRIVILVLYGFMIFLPFICSFICLYAPETGTLRLFSQTLHQKKGSHWLALTVFFVLSNSWVFLLIYATEEQIRRNNVLPGENNWGAGQILAMVLILIPLLGFVNVMLTSLGNHSTTARRWIKRTMIHRMMGIHFEPHHKHKRAESKGETRSKNTSLDLKKEIDLESQHHKKGTSLTETDGDPEEKMDAERTDTEDTNNESTTARSEDQQMTSPRQRLSKPASLMYARPEDFVIVVPGQESEPEDSVHAKKGKEALKVGANLSRRNSAASTRSGMSGRASSVSSATTTYTTVSVTTEGGRPRRRLSKRRARTEYGGSVVGGYDSEDQYRARRRLTKSPSVRARRSASLDRYWVERRELGGDRTPPWRASEGRPESTISARDGERSVNRLSYAMNVGKSEEVEDAAPKYFWDPERGWIEHGAKKK